MHMSWVDKCARAFIAFMQSEIYRFTFQNNYINFTKCDIFGCQQLWLLLVTPKDADNGLPFNLPFIELFPNFTEKTTHTHNKTRDPLEYVYFHIIQQQWLKYPSHKCINCSTINVENPHENLHTNFYSVTFSVWDSKVYIAVVVFVCRTINVFTFVTLTL